MPLAECFFKFSYEVHIFSLVMRQRRPSERNANLSPLDKAKILPDAQAELQRHVWGTYHVFVNHTGVKRLTECESFGEKKIHCRGSNGLRRM